MLLGQSPSKDLSPPPRPSSGSTKPTYSKRGKITVVACINCRRRKSKYDGKRPVCLQCQARDSQCHYDMSEDHRRLTYLRGNVKHLTEEKSTLEFLIRNLRVGREDEAIEILRRLRSGTDLHTPSQHVQAGQSLMQVKVDMMLELPGQQSSAVPEVESHHIRTPCRSDLQTTPLFKAFLETLVELRGDFIRNVSNAVSPHICDILHRRDLSWKYVFEEMDKEALISQHLDAPGFVQFCELA